MSDEVLVETVGAVSVITINRPAVKNAINRNVTLAIAEAVDELDRRDDLRLGVLTGAGGTFSSGMDLKAYLVGEDVTLPGRGLAGICTWSPRKPLIAAVEGWALAGGCEVALACDLIVAAEDAWFGISEVKRGLAAGGGGMLRLPRLLPPAIAMEMALTGDPLPATRAAGYGLVNVLTPSGGALEGALALAGRITPNAPLGLEVSKEIVRTAGDRPIEDEFAAQIPLMDMLFRSADSKEGARAFAEKRPPEWTGQ